MKVEPFLYRNIINEKSENIIFKLNKPKYEKIVLKLDKDYEITNGYFTILYINNQYKLYYRGCSFNYYKDPINKTYYGTEELAHHEWLCLATSYDGLNFEKNNYNNLFDNNIIKKDLFCHNFYPYYDKKNNKYLGLSGTGIFNNGLHLFESNDGINWIHIKKILDENNILPGWNHYNHFDSHNCISDKDEYYYIYFRDNKPNHRYVQFIKTKDFNKFTNSQNINIYENNHVVLYTPGIFKYENSNYFLGIPTIIGKSYDEKNNSTLMISEDGINFNILTKELFNNYTSSNIDIDESLIISKYNINSIVRSPDNSKMYIYTHNILEKDSFIACHSFEKDRINKIVCNDYGYIQTELIKLSNKITVNYETFNDGYFNISLINSNHEIFCNSINYYNFSYELIINWIDDKIIEPNYYYIKFEMYNCILYSFSYDH
jgi:hypothetical protein